MANDYKESRGKRMNGAEREAERERALSRAFASLFLGHALCSFAGGEIAGGHFADVPFSARDRPAHAPAAISRETFPYVYGRFLIRGTEGQGVQFITVQVYFCLGNRWTNYF